MHQNPINMKKSFLLLSIACGISVTVQAQGFYLKLNGGYNFPGLLNTAAVSAPRVSASGGSLGSDGLATLANIDEIESFNEPVKGSYGAGGNVGGGVGYMLNRWFGVELGVNHIWANSMKAEVLTVSSPSPGIVYPINAKIKTNATILTVSPSLVFVVSKPSWSVEPYAKIGLALPVYGKTRHYTDVIFPDELVGDQMFNAPRYFGKNNRMETQTQGTVSLGVSWSVGLRYTPKKQPFITVFLESNGQWLNVRGKKTTITKYETDGVDRLNNADPTLNRPRYRTEFVYHDALDGNSNNASYSTNTYNNPDEYREPGNIDVNKPKDDLRPIAPFSNIGIQIGIQFNFGKEALESLKKGVKK